MFKLLTHLIIASFVFATASTVVFGQDHLLEENFKSKTFKKPLREISIIVSDTGFYPSKVMAFQGEKIHFFITSTSKKNQCFILQKHEIFVSAEKGFVNEAEVILDTAGRFKFYCPSSKFTGHLTVIKKFSPKEDQERGIASKSKPKYWTPRDYD